MSSLKNFFRKKHRYESQADLKNMTAEQIVSINPKDVGYYIESETGGIPLEGVKKKAMFSLLAIKKREKETPNERARQEAITRFLEREGIKSNTEVDKLIAQVQEEMIEEDKVKMQEQIDMKHFENRVRALDNRPPIPYTTEEDMFLRLQKLGGKSKASSKSFGKTVSKRKRREKTRKGRKGPTSSS